VDQEETEERADDITGGEMYFSVQGSRVTAIAREREERDMNQDFVREGMCRRER
jgi:hypothetical protein